MRKVLVMLVFVAAFAACKKSEPPPAPVPTPVPTIAVSEDPVCFSPGPMGAPPFCKDATGKVVTCPSDTSNLPACGD